MAVPSVDDQGSSMPRGDFPPGIEDVLDYLADRYLSWSSSSAQEIDWCFLVGGPGNGKSEALRTLATKLGVQLPAKTPGQPVPRVVPPTWPTAAQPLKSGLEIVFINDASIPRADVVTADEPGSLFRDLSDGIHRLSTNGPPVAIFANVNRGILVEEASFLENGHASLSSSSGQFAVQMIRWLAEPPSSLPPSETSSSATSGIETVVAIDPLAPQYGQFRVPLHTANPPCTLVVHVVFLDVLSLFEPQPNLSDRVIDFSHAVPRVAPYHTLGNLLSTEVPRDATTGGKLVQAYVLPENWADGGCKDPVSGVLCDAFATCPFAQNSRWLQSSDLRHRFLDTLRAAEIAAGRRFTYRDLLGHLSLALLGRPEDQWLKGDHPCIWSAQQHQAVQAGNKGATINLSSHRVYDNLFRTSGSHSESPRLEKDLVGDTLYKRLKTLLEDSAESPRVQFFERAFNDIDPARDTDAWAGVRARVLDAVESLDVVIPSSQQVALWNEVPSEARSEIESILDNVLREEIAMELERGSGAAGRRVRILRRWRSILLLRQFGLALGNLAFGAAIQVWLAEQENALRGGQRLKLGDGINNLIIPSDEGRVFFAPLRPRTYCIIGELPPNTLLVSVAVSDLAVIVTAHGDTLIAEVQISRARERQAPLVLASIVVDLAVAREAILHADGDRGSFTEIGYTAFARIERARASLISRDWIKGMPVHFTDELEQLFKVSINPTGSVPLRVQRT